MFHKDLMFFLTYDWVSLVFSKQICFSCVYNEISQPKWPRGPWDHFMILVKCRLCIDILHSDPTFCEWPLFLFFLYNCMEKLCKCIRQHASCVKKRSMSSSKPIRSLYVVSLSNSCKYLENWRADSKHLALKSAACRQNLASQGSSANPPDSAEMVQTGPVQTWVLHAPGAKVTVVYTNSLKQCLLTEPSVRLVLKST